MIPNQEPLNKLNRLKEEYDALEKIRKLRSEKLARLRHVLIYETNEADKLQLEYQIQNEETKLEDIENKLSEIEQKLQQARSEYSPNNQAPLELPNTDMSEINQKIEQAEAEIRKIEQAEADSSQDKQTQANLSKNKERVIRSHFFSHLRTSKNRQIVILTVFTLCGVIVVWAFNLWKHFNLDVCELPAADVSSIDFSPNAKYLATGSLDKTVRVFNVTETITSQKNALVACQPHTEGILAVKFSPDGNYLATASLDSAYLWRVNNNGTINSNNPRDISHQTILKDNNIYKNSVVAISFSQDGKYLATAGADGEIKVWNTKTPQVSVLPTPQRQQKAYIVSVSWSDDGNYIATTDVNGLANVWMLKADDLNVTPQLWQSIPNVTDIVFSLKHNIYATASADGTVQVWDILNRQKSIVSHKENTYVRDISFSPTGKFIVALSLDKKAYIWDWQNNVKEHLLEETDNNTDVTAVTFSSNDKYLAIANTNRKVTIWDKSTGKRFDPVRPKGNGLIMALAFSKDEKYLAMASADGSIVIKKLDELARLVTFLGLKNFLDHPQT